MRMIHGPKWLSVGFCIALWSVQLAAQEARPWTVMDRSVLKLHSSEPGPVYEIEAILVEGIGWVQSDVTEAIFAATRILQQCNLSLGRLQVTRVRVSVEHRHLDIPHSRRLAAGIAPSRPALFFVDDTRNRPAFDAEAFGSGNSRSRPELRHTAWFTRGTPHLAQAIAHELFHVLADSGAHHDDAGNLMYSETAAGRQRLDPPQCAKLIEESRKNNLLREH